MSYVIQDIKTKRRFDNEWGWVPDAPSDRHKGIRGPMVFPSKTDAEYFIQENFDSKTFHTMEVVIYTFSGKTKRNQRTS